MPHKGAAGSLDIQSELSVNKSSMFFSVNDLAYHVKGGHVGILLQVREQLQCKDIDY